MGERMYQQNDERGWRRKERASKGVKRKKRESREKQAEGTEIEAKVGLRGGLTHAVILTLIANGWVPWLGACRWLMALKNR